MSSAYPTAAAPLRGQATNISGSALITIQQAFERFTTTVAPEDRREFQDTRLEDVRNAALQIEKDLAARRSLKNMRRLYPFLQGLEHYSKSIEVLCNGTLYLPWIWAPVKLILQITSDHLSAFEKLIEAYGKIADALPRFDRLSAALSDNHDFQAVVALMYADILEFHRRAYRFVRRKSWRFFFMSMWDNFDSRFKSILANLAYHSDLIDKESISFDIVASTKHRKEDLERFEKHQREWKNAKLSATLSWLGFSSHVVDHKLDNLTRDCSPGSCDWLLKHPKVIPWLQKDDKCSVVWLHGKPGAGKSVLSANLVQHLEETFSDVFFYFCSYSDTTAGTSGNLFRSLVAQIVQAHPDTAIYISENFINLHKTSSRKALLSLLPELLEIVGTTYLVIDGLDEWDLKEQQFIMVDILSLASSKCPTKVCKIFISSRDMPNISRVLRQNKEASTVLSLDKEHKSVDLSIHAFIKTKLDEYGRSLHDLDPNGSIFLDVHRILVEKSNGMFLWVRLVLDSFDSIYTPEDLRRMVTLLPSDLEDLYERIIGEICDPRNKIRHAKTTAIFRWIAYAQRPIRLSELLHGLALTSAEPSPDIRSVPLPEVLELCKPLVEQRPDGTVGFVHFSVQEYLRSEKNVISNVADTHQLISLACTTMLSQGLRLLHPDIDPQSRPAFLAQGIYGLMKYSLQFWHEHIFACAANGGDTSSNATLTNSLSALYSIHEHIRRKVHHEKKYDDNLDTLSSSGPQDKRLQCIAHLPICSIISESLRLRFISKNDELSDGQAIEVFAIEHDSTLFSKLAADFDSWILDLLSKTSIEGIPDQMLTKSQAAFAGSAYRCRYSHCTVLSNSFATPTLRKEHEATHFPRFYCKITSCPWNRIGFKDQSALKKHDREHHDKDNRLMSSTKIRLLPREISLDSVRKQNRKQIEDGWPPIFSYNREKSQQHLSENYLDKVSPKYVREGEDWFAFFEPHQPRYLDIEMVHTIKHFDPVICANFSSCGTYLCTLSNEELNIFETSTGKEIEHFNNFEDGMNLSDAFFVSGTQSIIGAGLNGFVEVWSFDPAERSLSNNWKAHNDEIYAIDVSNDGTIIATGSEDCTIKIWSTSGPGEELDVDGLGKPINTFEVGNTVINVALSPDQCSLVATYTNTDICVWNLESGQMIAKFHVHGSIPWSVAFTPTHSHIVSGSFDGKVRIWELDPTIQRKAKEEGFGASCVQTIEGHAGSIWSVATSPDSRFVFSAGLDRSVRITDPGTGALQCIIIGHSDEVSRVCCSPTGEYLVTASTDHTARVWRYKPYQKTPSELEY